MSTLKKSSTLLSLALLGLTTAGSASAQTYLPAEGMRIFDQQRRFFGGQRVDLAFDIQNPDFQYDECPDGTKVLKGCTFDVRIGWNWLQGPQCEADGDENGDDQFRIMYRGRQWQLQSVTLNGGSIFAPGNPSGELGAGADGGGGLRITPPAGFETGGQSYTYKFTFQFQPNGDECNVHPLEVRGTYRHTYDGLPVFWIDDSVSIGVGYPWGVSAGVNFQWTNDYMWSKELVEPFGINHWKKLSPDASAVAQKVPCCGSETQTPEPTPPTTPGGSTETPPGEGGDSPGTGSSFDFNGRFEASDGLSMAELIAQTPDGNILAESQLAFAQPQMGGVTERLHVNVPETYPYDSVIVVATAFDADNERSSNSFVIPVQADTEPRVDLHRSSLDDATRLTAHNFTPGTTVVFYAYLPQLLGDLDFDLDVDADDHALFVNTDWSAIHDLDVLTGDLDGNMVVDATDLAILTAFMGQSEAVPTPAPGCPDVILPVANVQAFLATVDESGRAELSLGILPPAFGRLLFGAVDLATCDAAEHRVFLSR